LTLLQSELSVDDFLSPHDSRIMAEGTFSTSGAEPHLLMSSIDLTDKFDFSFLFGDLNFRLDIQRLHADWLISRKGNISCTHTRLGIEACFLYRLCSGVDFRPTA